MKSMICSCLDHNFGAKWPLSASRCGGAFLNPPASTSCAPCLSSNGLYYRALRPKNLHQKWESGSISSGGLRGRGGSCRLKMVHEPVLKSPRRPRMSRCGRTVCRSALAMGMNSSQKRPARSGAAPYRSMAWGDQTADCCLRMLLSDEHILNGRSSGPSLQ